jgi:arginyl-tRNA synthetase
MLSLNGNTAPYLQNAYVRIRSIFRKLAEEGLPAADPSAEVIFIEPAEIALAKKLFQFGEVVPQILDDYRPNVLANYLFELANTYHGFYENCPVLRAEGAARNTRLLLCAAAANVLRQGLNLLGIEVPERM